MHFTLPGYSGSEVGCLDHPTSSSLLAYLAFYLFCKLCPPFSNPTYSSSSSTQSVWFPVLCPFKPAYSVIYLFYFIYVCLAFRSSTTCFFSCYAFLASLPALSLYFLFIFFQIFSHVSELTVVCSQCLESAQRASLPAPTAAALLAAGSAMGTTIVLMVPMRYHSTPPFASSV